MSVQSPYLHPNLSTIIADYAPQEAVRLLGANAQSDVVNVQEMSKSTHVVAFLKVFNQQGFLLIHEGEMFDRFPYITGDGIEDPEGIRRLIVAYDFDRHFSESYEDAIEGYRVVRTWIRLAGPQINKLFNEDEGFTHKRFGFGYLRPNVQVIPPHIWVNNMARQVIRKRQEDAVGMLLPDRDPLPEDPQFHKTVTAMTKAVRYDKESHRDPHLIGTGCGVSDSRLLPYTEENNKAMAPVMAQIFIEEGVRANATMLANARKDGMGAVVELIEENQPELIAQPNPPPANASAPPKPASNGSGCIIA